jgi:hypothetical protein
VQGDLVQRGVDVARLVADDLEAHAAGHLGRQARQVLLGRVDDGHRVLARLPAHLEDDARHPVQPRHRALLGGAVLRPPHVAHADGRAVDRGDHHVLERARIGDAPERAKGGLAQAGGDVAARHVRVLAHERVAHRDDGQPVGGEAVRIDPHVDRAAEAADQTHLADAVGALELHLHDLVGELRQLAQRRSPATATVMTGACHCELR